MTAPSAITRYSLAGKTYVVDPQSKLGSGSEGMVIPHPADASLCVKLFHPADPHDVGARQIASYRSQKVQAICGMGINLPPQFMLPMSPVFTPHGGDVIGFQMPRVPPGYHKLMKLLDGNFRVDHQVGLRQVAEIFAGILDDLDMIHSLGLVVGDVNLGCVLVKDDARAWVDTDSWSYRGYPCLATTEMFAHPDLYANLTEGGTHVPPRPHHDRFAFLVAFTLLAIPGAHPFRMGTHPSVRGLQNRATAGITLFDPDVKFPVMLGSPDVLSDEVLHALVERLKRRTDQPFNTELLRAFAQEVASCSTCGLEYHNSRRQCPKCQATTLIQAPALVDFLIEEFFKVRGTLLFAQFVEQDLYLVCREGAKVQVIRLDEQGNSTVLSSNLPNVPGARYRFFKDCLVVCLEPTQPAPAGLMLFRIDGDKIHSPQSTTTGVLEGEDAVFETSSRFLYRTASNALVRTELFGAMGVLVDTHVAEVHQRQSWFTADRVTGADREVIFGYDRALRNWEWFVILGNQKGSAYRYSKVGDLGMPLDETVQDFAVYFSDSSVLLVMRTSRSGRDYARYAVIGLDGHVHLNKVIDSSDSTYQLWEVLRGKIHQGKSVLHVTPDGIVKQQFSDGNCTVLPGTSGHVSADDQLVRLGRRVGVVSRGGVSVMTRKK